ncbi:MAG TPA: hypothetical protein VH415_12425 [Nitrososphaeraceae archaeon]
MKSRATNRNLFILHMILFIGLSVSSFQFNLGQSTAVANSYLIHGGGSGSISCSDGSLHMANIAFIILFANGTASGNWTLDNLNDPSNPGTVFSVGEIFDGNASLSQYQVKGETRNIAEVIKLCNPPLFSPLFLTGACGENVQISLQFQSNNPLGIRNNFEGDVICEMVKEASGTNNTNVG